MALGGGLWWRVEALRGCTKGVGGTGVMGVSRSIDRCKKIGWPEKYSGEWPKTAGALAVRGGRRNQGRERVCCDECVFLLYGK